ncbi:MAG: hypothetical protein ABSA92_10390 [Candidatus Bathyarchaeia archaeon]
MNLRTVLFLIAIVAFAAYGISILIHAVETVNAIFQSGYSSTGGGHAILVAVTVAVGIAILCIIPGVFLLVRSINKLIAKKRQSKSGRGSSLARS